MERSFTDQNLSWWTAFMRPGARQHGRNLGAGLPDRRVILIATGVGSWRTMAGVVLGTIGMATLFNAIGSATNPYFAVPFWWHMVAGGWAFGHGVHGHRPGDLAVFEHRPPGSTGS
jgi:Na+-transporting NADH:ubiquinone oxidoreductase subunit B